MAGPDPELEETWRVFCPRTGRQFEFPEYGWKLAEYLDGTLDLERWVQVAPEALGLDIEPQAVREFYAKLESWDLLTQGPVAKAPEARMRDPGAQWTVTLDVPTTCRIEVHPEARYECRSAGTCCEAGYVISLSLTEAQRIRDVTPKVLGAGCESPIVLLPTRPGEPWKHALGNDPACPFLDEDKLCRIHEYDAQPKTCRIYPLAFVQAGDVVRASVTHRCVCGSRDEGPLLSERQVDLQDKLTLSVLIPTLPESIRIDAMQRLPRDDVVEVLTWAALEHGLQPWEMLRAAAERLLELTVDVGVAGRSVEPRLFQKKLLEDLQDATELTVLHALAGRRHPNHRRIRRQMRAAELHFPDADPLQEMGRFVRDQLYGLRLFRYASVAEGLLGIGLALYGIEKNLPKRSRHPAAREGVMLWEEALMSPALRTVLGPGGPFPRVGARLGTVVRQLKRFRKNVRGR